MHTVGTLRMTFDMFTCSDNDLEIIRKENFFKEELTEEERDLVAKRVLMHQKLVKRHERREKRRKSKKIRIMFDYVNDEEIDEMLLDCKGDEVHIYGCICSYLY